jgi:hypothetical protein
MRDSCREWPNTGGGTIARGSALESLAALDLLDTLITDPRLVQARVVALRVVQRTSGLLCRSGR